MGLFLASYNIEEKHKGEYQELWDYFDSLGAVKILFSKYAVPFAGTAYQLGTNIIPHLQSGDRLLVCELFNGGDTAAWKSLMISDAEFQKLLTKFARTFQ